MDIYRSEDRAGAWFTDPPTRPARRCVVTGAAGFIGSHLVDALLARGDTVTGIDVMDPFYDVTQKRDNLEAARIHPAFTLLEADLMAPEAGSLLDRADVVFHLAGRPGVQSSWGQGFNAASRANVELTQRVYEAALAGGAAQVVYASSSSVYGTGTGPLSRRGGRRATRPISPYGVTKLAGEQLADVYRVRGLTVTCLRYFTVYGPRQRPDMAMHRLFEATRPGGPCFVRRGDGHQEREFTYVSDVVAATIAASATPAATNRTFDVGGGSAASLNQVTARIAAITGVQPQVASQPTPPGDPTHTRADLATTIRVLDWRPQVDLTTGLEAQARWHRARWSGGGGWVPCPSPAAGPAGRSPPAPPASRR